MRIIGLDPGLRSTGWGVVDVRGSRLTHVANGRCASKGDDLSTRLASLFRQLDSVLSCHKPDGAAVESVFVNKDPASTLKLGQARSLCLLVPALRGIVVHEYAPNTVKKSVVGVGHADKVQVDLMVRMLLPGVELENPDAADALAVAICHAHTSRGSARLDSVSEKQAGFSG